LGECPREGDPAPDFEIGPGRRLSSLAGSPVVIYFYPRAFTAGCTRELRRFVELLGEFESLGATVVGVSADPPGAVARFAAAHGARPPLFLVPDPARAVIGAYCAGSERGRGARRVTFVVGPDGRVAAVLEGLRRAEDHADAALEAVRRLAARRRGPGPAPRSRTPSACPSARSRSAARPARAASRGRAPASRARAPRPRAARRA